MKKKRTRATMEQAIQKLHAIGGRKAFLASFVYLGLMALANRQGSPTLKFTRNQLCTIMGMGRVNNVTETLPLLEEAGLLKRYNNVCIRSNPNTLDAILIHIRIQHFTLAFQNGVVKKKSLEKKRVGELQPLTDSTVSKSIRSSDAVVTPYSGNTTKVEGALASCQQSRSVMD